MKPRLVKVELTERAVMQRIDRRLKQDLEKLKKSRTVRAEMALGRFYVLDLRRNIPVYVNVDLEELARGLKVIQPWEAVEAGGK